MTNHKLYLCKDGIEIEASVRIPITDSIKTIVEKISYNQEGIYKNLELVKITPLLEGNVLKKILLEVKGSENQPSINVAPIISNAQIVGYNYIGKALSISKKAYDLYENNYFYRLIKTDDKKTYTTAKIRYEAYLKLLEDHFQSWTESKVLGKQYNWIGMMIAIFFEKLEVKQVKSYPSLTGAASYTYLYKVKDPSSVLNEEQNKKKYEKTNIESNNRTEYNKKYYHIRKSRKPPETHIVDGYYKKSGAYVAPHKRGGI